jgi:hypothetical protein
MVGFFGYSEHILEPIEPDGYECLSCRNSLPEVFCDAVHVIITHHISLGLPIGIAKITIT